MTSLDIERTRSISRSPYYHSDSGSFLIRRTQLSKRMQAHIKSEEKRLGYRCTKIWDFTNPDGTVYVFGKFKDGTKEGLIVTLGYAEKHLNNKILPIYFTGGST